MNVHKGDPITSYEAAAAIEPVRHAHKAKVLAALAQHPERCFWDRVIPDESATHKENMEDMARKFRGSRGATHRWAKLTPRQVQMIRELRAEGMETRALAVQFGISARHVYDICLGRVWRERPRETQKALL